MLSRRGMQHLQQLQASCAVPKPGVYVQPTSCLNRIPLPCLQALAKIAVRSGEPYRLQCYSMLSAACASGGGVDALGVHSVTQPTLALLDRLYAAQVWERCLSVLLLRILAGFPAACHMRVAATPSRTAAASIAAAAAAAAAAAPAAAAAACQKCLDAPANLLPALFTNSHCRWFWTSCMWSMERTPAPGRKTCWPRWAAAKQSCRSRWALDCVLAAGLACSWGAQGVAYRGGSVGVGEDACR